MYTDNRVRQQVAASTVHWFLGRNAKYEIMRDYTTIDMAVKRVRTTVDEY